MKREEYRKIKLFITKDDILIGNRSLMCMAEKPFIQRQAENIIIDHKPESVLEIGFGFGLTAKIFKANVKRHLVIEPHPLLAQKARDAGYDVWEGFAQDFETDEEFDVIYDDRDEVLDEECKLKERVKHKKYIMFELCR